MTNQHFNYTIEPLERFIFTPSEVNGHRNFFFSISSKETKRLSVKVKIISDCLEFEYLHRNTTSCVVNCHCRLKKI